MPNFEAQRMESRLQPVRRGFVLNLAVNSMGTPCRLKPGLHALCWRWALSLENRSRQQLFYHMSVYVGEAKIAAGAAEGELLVVETEQP